MNGDPGTGPMLAGKACLIIGASRGIGAATANEFADQGARLVIASRDLAAMEALARPHRELGREIECVALDVDDAAAVQACVDVTVARFGGLDVAFNNAAVNPHRGRMGDVGLEDFDRVIATNLRAVFVAMRAEINAMLASGGGSIINTASSGGLVGFSQMAAYVASKHGVVGLTKTAALDYGRMGIRVNAVAPGAVWTEMLQAGSGSTPEGKALIESVTPMGRIGAPLEIGKAVAWLASDHASFVTGITMPVDGGYIIP